MRLASEWTKLRSLRSNLAILGGTIAIGIVLVWVLAVFVKTDPDTLEAFTIGNSFSFATWLSTVMAVVAGTLMFTPRGATRYPRRRDHRGTCSMGHRGSQDGARRGFGLAMGIAGMIAGLSGGALGSLDTGDTSGMPATAA